MCTTVPAVDADREVIVTTAAGTVSTASSIHGAYRTVYISAHRPILNIATPSSGLSLAGNETLSLRCEHIGIASVPVAVTIDGQSWFAAQHTRGMVARLA